MTPLAIKGFLVRVFLSLFDELLDAEFRQVKQVEQEMIEPDCDFSLPWLQT